MCALSRVSGFNRSYSSRESYLSGRPSYVNGKLQQQEANRKNAGRLAIVLGTVVAAFLLRKPLGKMLTPLKNSFASKFPNLSDALSSVKARAGRIFKPLFKKTAGWFKDTAVPKAQEGVTSFLKKIKNIADSDLPKKVNGSSGDVLALTCGQNKPLLLPPRV